MSKERGRRPRRGKRDQRNDEPRPPRLFNVVQVRFDTNFMRHECDAQELQVAKGDRVVVDTSRGPVIATALGFPQRKMISPDAVRRVLRVALEQDVSQHERNVERERDAYRFALERIRTRRLPMKLIRAQYMLDGSKIVFYFSADGRIDFRDLVKDLAHRFRTRIEMHQIGARDGARMLGGIGPCGRELCCSTFLEEFAPVSIRMAKDQGLTLNPKKVSGMCGRLMCCLVYEQQLYKKMRRALPRPGKMVRVESGVAKILSVDVINQRVTVEMPDTNRRTLPVSEIAPYDPNAEPPEPKAPAEVEYLWDDVVPAGDGDAQGPRAKGASSEDGKPSGKRRRRRRRRGGSKGEGGEQRPPKSGGDASDSPGQEQPTRDKGGEKSGGEEGGAKRRRRRRGGRRRKGGQGGQGGQSGEGSKPKAPDSDS